MYILYVMPNILATSFAGVEEYLKNISVEEYINSTVVIH